MKKLIAMFSVAMIALAGFASSPAAWIASEEGRMQVEKIRIGVNTARITLENGEKIVMPLDKLESYSLHGKIYEKRMVYDNGKPTGEMAYMQLISSRNGFKLFRNAEFDYDAPQPFTAVDKFYVFKGDDLYLALDEKSIPSVFSFYGLEYSYQ